MQRHTGGKNISALKPQNQERRSWQRVRWRHERREFGAGIVSADLAGRPDGAGGPKGAGSSIGAGAAPCPRCHPVQSGEAAVETHQREEPVEMP